MTNLELVGTLNGLGRIKEENKILPVRVSYAINKNLKKLIEAYKPYEEERAKILEGIDEKTDEEKEVANEQLEALLSIDNKDIVVHQIPLSDIENCENLTIEDIAALDFMIIEEGQQ